MVIAANKSAVGLVRRTLALLPGFRDTTVLDGKLVHFYKRAQILVGDLWSAFDKPAMGSASPFAFDDIDQLTIFADYRIPQLLHHLKVLEYDQDLSSCIYSHAELPSGSRMEVLLTSALLVPFLKLSIRLRCARVLWWLGSFLGRNFCRGISFQCFR